MTQDENGERFFWGYLFPGIPTTIKTMGVNISTIVYLRVLINQILIIPVSKWIVTPIYKAFIRGRRTPFRGLTITMVINHFLTGMILQVFVKLLGCTNFPNF